MSSDATLSPEVLESLPEAVRAHFPDGEFRPQGFVPKHTHEAMKGDKTKLQERLTTLESAVAGKDELEKELQTLKDRIAAEGAGTTDEEVSKLLEERTERMRADHDAQLTSLQEKLEDEKKSRAKLDERLAELLIDGSITEACIKLGTFEHAIPDAKNEGRKIYKLEEGVPVARKADGSPMFGGDGSTGLTPEEWVAGMKQDRPHWWPNEASGGGATGNRTGSNGVIKLTGAAAKDPAAYKAAKEQAEKSGGQVQLAG